MISISNLSKSYGKVSALSNVTFDLAQGTYALLGPNACGKTTLIKCILGLVIPNQGEIKINHQSIQKQYLYRDQIGYMPQIGRYPSNLKINQLFKLLQDYRNYNGPLDTELIESFKLLEMGEKSMGSLSGGTIQKVSAAIAFMFHPSLLILDEPTAGLDPVATAIFKQKILKSKSENKTIIITSHNLSELDELVDNIVFMQEGKLIFNENKEDLKKRINSISLEEAMIHVLTTKG